MHKAKHLFFTVLFVFSGIGAYCGHIIGGYLSYECIGPLANNNSLVTYEVTLKLYVDCGPSSSPNPLFATISIFNEFDVNFYDIVLWFKFIDWFMPSLSSQWRLLGGLLEGFFCISFQELRLLRRASHWQLIQKKPRTKVQLTRKIRLIDIQENSCTHVSRPLSTILSGMNDA